MPIAKCGNIHSKHSAKEQILEEQVDPEWYNDYVIFPDKMRINEVYAIDYSFRNDVKYLWQTMLRFVVTHSADNANHGNQNERAAA